MGELFSASQLIGCFRQKRPVFARGHEELTLFLEYFFVLGFSPKFFALVHCGNTFTIS